MKKKLISIIIPIVLIFVIGAVLVGNFLYKKYSYSDEMGDLDTHFNSMSVNEYLDELKANTAMEEIDSSFDLFNDTVESIIPITIGVERTDIYAVKIADEYYLSYDNVKDVINDRFYIDSNEGYLLYATATDVARANIESSNYVIKGEDKEFKTTIATYLAGEYYISLEYVKLFTNYTYDVFNQPYRLKLETEFEERNVASVSKDSAVRSKGGIKSPILKTVVEGERLIILEELETWVEVMTNDLFIGYIEKKHIDGYTTYIEEKPTHYVEEEFTRIQKDRKISMGWHQVTNLSANSSIDEVLRESRGINVISPTWYFLNDNDGGFVDISSKSYVDKAHNKGVEVWALVENIAYGNEISIYDILSYTSKREKLISNLISSTLAAGIDGINLDFETIPEEAGDHYVQFVRELSIACRLNELVFSVDNYVPMPHTDHYNRKEQGVFADYVVIMGYDEHWHNSGDAGSVASIDFVELGIKKTLEDVPADKIINAIPFYTNIWTTKAGETTDKQVGMSYAEQTIANYGVEAEWDEETCQNYAEIVNGDELVQVWLEDEKSISVKLSVMDANNLAGVAQWKLGLEKDDIWDIIINYISN